MTRDLRWSDVRRHVKQEPLKWDKDAPSGGPIAYVAVCMALIGLAVVVGQMVRAWIQ